MPEHHRIFADAQLWSGRIADHVDIDFLGACEDKQFFLREWSEVERDPLKVHDQWTNLPEFNEEYFEWIDLLAAVRTARERFVMIELGAGYGRWLMRAAAAVRRYNPIPTFLIGVEAEPTHVRWMHRNFRNNGLDPAEHRIIHAAVGPSSGTVCFPAGDPYEWGQTILEGGRTGPQTSRYMGWLDYSYLTEVRAVPQVTIAEAAANEPLIDIIDMDIQGAEAAVMEAAIEFCSQRVRLIHIGTHSRAIEQRLREIFQNANWLPRFDFANEAVGETKYGALSFGDGVQSWANPRFVDRLIGADLMEQPGR